MSFAVSAQDNPEHVSGRAEVLQQQKVLNALAERCGQADVVSSLSYYLDDPDFGGKLPHLYLFRSRENDELVAAVLLFEYTIRGWRSGIFISPDAEGERTVLAPVARRQEFAWSAAKMLLRQDAGRLVLLTLSDVGFTGMAATDATFRTRATQQRTSRHDLALKSTLDETLAKFGARTRRNIRAARRKAVQREHAEFFPSIEMTEEEFLAFSRESAYPVREEVARWRFRSASKSGYLAGLRSAAGEWLALAGGRKQAAVMIVDWQMNRRDLPGLSLGLTMRAFLMEHAIAEGLTVLRFEGGTSHPMRNGFIMQTAGYALLGNTHPAIVRGLVRRVMPKQSLLNTWIDWDRLTWHG